MDDRAGRLGKGMLVTGVGVSGRWSASSTPPSAHRTYRLSVPSGSIGWEQISPVDTDVRDGSRPDTVTVTTENVRQIIEWFASDKSPCPLLAITGQSQTGKTRMAVAAGNEWVEAKYTDGADERLKGGLTAHYVTEARVAQRLKMVGGLLVIEIEAGNAEWMLDVFADVTKARSDSDLRTIVVAGGRLPEAFDGNVLEVKLNAPVRF